MKKIFIYITMLLATLCACEKVVDIPVEYTTPKLVVNAILDPTENININVSRSMHVLDSKEIVMIEGANIKIYENGELITPSYTYENGNYLFDYKPKAEHSYKITVEKENFESTSTECDIPKAVSIESIDYKIVTDDEETENYNYPYDYKYSVDIDFFDPPQTSNFYLLSVDYIIPEWNMSYDENSYQTTWHDSIKWNTYSASVTSPDAIATESSLFRGVYFNDELINGNKYCMKINFSTYQMFQIFEISPDDSVVTEYDLKMIVKLKNISSEYYKFIKSIETYIENEGNPFAEPVIIKTNIENGLGMVAAKSCYSDTITVKVTRPEYFDEEYYYKKKQ